MGRGGGGRWARSCLRVLGLGHLRVFGRGVVSVVWRRFRRHDEDGVFALLGLVQLQQTGVLGGVSLHLGEEHRDPSGTADSAEEVGEGKERRSLQPIC